MPEGDTVWNTARMLHGALAGQTLRHSDFRVPSLATVDLAGWRVRHCRSRGKHLLLRVEDGDTTLAGPAGGPGAGVAWTEESSDEGASDEGRRRTKGPVARASEASAERQSRALTLHSHLRMDGTWRIYSPGEPWRGRPAHLIRVVLRTLTTVAVGYHLHELALVPTEREESLVGHLGPDLLGAAGQPGGWDAVEAVRRLRARPDGTIAEALLDQRCLAGLGNLYKAEVLFLRGVHPRTLVSKVDDLDGMVGLAHRLINANRGRWTQATTGSTRRGEEVYVYGRPGAPCRRCGTPIRRETLGERVTYWCPSCQPDTG